MRNDLYCEMFKQEDYYWWHVSRRNLILQALALEKPNQRLKIFDAGCGTGALLSDLKRRGYQCFGGDISLDSLRFCRKRGLKNIQLLNFEEELPFRNNTFDAITCLDVLEHVERDGFLLLEFYRILRPKGRMYLTVPAYNFLMSYWDHMVGHKRRYFRKDLVNLLENSGFRICRSSYFYSFLLLPVLLFRLIKSFIGNQNSDFVEVSRWLNQFLILIAKAEQFLVLNRGIPFGLSIFVEAEKY